MRVLSEERIERAIGRLLRMGVVAAAVLVATGGVVYVARHGSDPADYRVFHGEPSELRSLPGILGAAREIRGRGLIQLGLVVLLATPMARVAFSVVAFALQRDRLYVGVTLFVGTVLLYSVFARAG
jgi:uncharacterized membrane protein